MKKSIERKLGLRPTREELIKDHFRLCQVRDAWQRDIRDLRDIILTLADLYTESKSECCLCRQGTLKNIIEATVTDYNNFCTLREVRLEMEGRRLADGNIAGSSSSGPLSRLKENAMAIANIQKELQAWEKLNEEFEEVSSMDIEKQSGQVKKDVLQLEWEYVNLRNKLEYLSDAAEVTAGLCCLSRYDAYKHAIKAVFLDAAITAQRSPIHT